MGGWYQLIYVSPDMNSILFIKFYFSYVCQKLDFVYHNSCFRHNVERECNIFDKNLTHEEVQKYMFMFILKNFC